MTDRTPLTVGDLRKALAAFSDETPVRVAVPDPDDEQFSDDRFIPTAVSRLQSKWTDRGWVDHPYITIELDPIGD
ncbi:hypothetical protein [Streptomyces sp. NPDC020141]|uniref:hypothetical protein n=1 Tax=Streptomyces sp. NPDC020141 TaxID=3365065 RepID=UPI0037B79D50